MDKSIKYTDAIAFLREYDFSKQRFADECGLQVNVLAGYLDGKDIPSPLDVARKVNETIERLREKYEPAPRFPFVETTVSRRVFEVAELCRKFEEMAVLCGDAGTGKTAALREYASRNDSTVLIEVDPSFTPGVLVLELAKRLHKGHSGTMHDLTVQILASLRATQRLLIFDEAELLNEKSLETIRRIQDKTGVPVLLAGMPKLIALIRGKRGESAQLYSRIGLYVELPKLQEEDVKNIVATLCPSSNGTWIEFCNKAHGNVRRLAKLVARARHIARLNHMSITAEVIQRASEILID
jgi:DNA transposition AAA+ family ATPase